MQAILQRLILAANLCWQPIAKYLKKFGRCIRFR
jgi:hypothetical protein